MHLGVPPPCRRQTRHLITQPQTSRHARKPLKTTRIPSCNNTPGSSHILRSRVTTASSPPHTRMHAHTHTRISMKIEASLANLTTNLPQPHGPCRARLRRAKGLQPGLSRCRREAPYIAHISPACAQGYAMLSTPMACARNLTAPVAACLDLTHDRQSPATP